MLYASVFIDQLSESFQLKYQIQFRSLLYQSCWNEFQTLACTQSLKCIIRGSTISQLGLGKTQQSLWKVSQLRLSSLSAPSQLRLSSVSAPSQLRLSSISAPSQFRLSFVSAPSQLHLSSVSAPSQLHLSSISAPSQLRLSSVSALSQLRLSSVCLSFVTAQCVSA